MSIDFMPVSPVRETKDRHGVRHAKAECTEQEVRERAAPNTGAALSRCYFICLRGQMMYCLLMLSLLSTQRMVLAIKSAILSSFTLEQALL